jgi:hypothetical protein
MIDLLRGRKPHCLTSFRASCGAMRLIDYLASRDV